MSTDVQQIGNITLSSDFLDLIQRFDEQYGSDSFVHLASCIGFDGIAHKDEVRGYDLAPFEAELVFPTGSNGEHMGWLNLCPSLPSFKKPFICWAPLGGHVFFHGLTASEVLRNSIKYLHEPDYDTLDLEFLDSLGVNPTVGDEILLVNYDNEPLQRIPLEIPDQYRYEITIDGVGVVAHEKFFAKNIIHESSPLSLAQYLDLARKFMDAGAYASALFYLKEAYFRLYYNDDFDSEALTLLQMKRECYTALNMVDASLLVEREILNRGTT